MSDHPIHDITEYSEDPRTSTRDQYAVRLTYADGRTGIHIRPSRQSAATMVAIHRQMMVQEDAWQVVDVELIKRAVTITLGDWEEVV